MFIVWGGKAYGNEENYLKIWVMEMELQSFTVKAPAY